MCRQLLQSARGVLALLLLPAMALAQGTTGSVGGAVRDQQNLVISGATVTVAAVETTFTRTVTSGSEGGFEFPGLLPGDYVLTTELTGFQREQRRVRLEVNQRVRLDIVLRAGGVAQEVEVRETVPLLHATDVAVGDVIRSISSRWLNCR